MSGPGSSVGIVTDYGLDGPGIDSRWERDFPSVQTGPGAHPPSCTMGTGSFPAVEAAGVWGWPPHPLLVPKVLEKSRTIPLLNLRACVAYKNGENLITNVALAGCWLSLQEYEQNEVYLHVFLNTIQIHIRLFYFNWVCRIIRFVIPIVFIKLTRVQCMYWSDTTVCWW